MLGRFRIAAIYDIENVPVCADYCDDWFDVCQDDLTCVESWLEELIFAPDMSNNCPNVVAHFVMCMAMVKDSATECGEVPTVTPPIGTTAQ